MVRRQDASSGQIIDDKPLDSGADAKDEQGKPLLHVKVYSPYKNYFDEYAYSISAVNRTGPFDVLPKHHRFISLLAPCELNIASKRGEPVKVRISGGIMHVRENQVVVFLDV